MPFPTWLPRATRSALNTSCAYGVLAIAVSTFPLVAYAADTDPNTNKGAGKNPDVSVDLSVLEALGSPSGSSGAGTPHRPTLRAPVLKPPKRLRLKMPSGQREAATEKPKAPARVKRATARPSPLPKPTVIASPPTPRARPEPVATAALRGSATAAKPKPAATIKTAAVAPARAKPERRVTSSKTAKTQMPVAVQAKKTRTAAATPTAAPTPKELETPIRTAALSSPAEKTEKNLGPVRLTFVSRRTELTVDDNRRIGELAKSLKQDSRLRLELNAYAAEGLLSPREARRLSLSRALTVRSRLIKSGVLSSRISVRALGGKSTEGPPDRVDLIISAR